MKELGIIINKILKDWLQSKGEGDIVFTDDIAINAVTDEIVSECHKEYDELLRQRDELREAINSLLFMTTGKGEPCGDLNWDAAEKRAINALKNSKI